MAQYKNNTTRSKHVNSCINKYWFQLTPTVCVFSYSTQVEELQWFPNCGLAKIAPHIENIGLPFLPSGLSKSGRFHEIQQISHEIQQISYEIHSTLKIR